MKARYAPPALALAIPFAAVTADGADIRGSGSGGDADILRGDIALYALPVPQPTERKLLL